MEAMEAAQVLTLQLSNLTPNLRYTEKAREALAERYNLSGNRAYPKKFSFAAPIASSPFTQRSHLIQLREDNEEMLRGATSYQERIKAIEEGSPLEADAAYQSNFSRYSSTSYEEIQTWASELPEVSEVAVIRDKIHISFHPALLHPIIESEEGALGRPSGPTYLSITPNNSYLMTTEYGHPHIGAANHCLGNAAEIATGLMGDNNVKEFIRHMAAYRLGYNEADLLDYEWGNAAARWWSQQSTEGRRIQGILIQDSRTGEVRPLGDFIVPLSSYTGADFREAACRLTILLLQQQGEVVELVERRCPHCEGDSLAVSGRDIVRICLGCQQASLRCTCEGEGRGTLGNNINYLHYQDISPTRCRGCNRRGLTSCYVWRNGNFSGQELITEETVNCEECMYTIYDQLSSSGEEVRPSGGEQETFTASTTSGNTW